MLTLYTQTSPVPYMVLTMVDDIKSVVNNTKNEYLLSHPMILLQLPLKLRK